MPHRIPKKGDVTTTDGLLLQEAVDACGDILMTDLRIQRQYAAWIEAHDLDRLARLVHVWGTQPYISQFQQAVWGGPLPWEIEALRAVLRPMGVRWPWVSPVLLTKHFPVRYATDYDPAHPPQFQPGQLELVSPARKGRQPTAEDFASVRRQVGWWFAFEVKEPHATIPELEAQERARVASLGQGTIASRVSTVFQGIQRVKRLLSVWTAYEINLVER